MSFPHWRYYPTNEQPPDWLHRLVDALATYRDDISTLEGNRPTSNEVLATIAPALASLGYTVETGRERVGKIRRPVLFGENGIPALTYEVDAAHDEHGIVVEVEAGRGARSNADYRDLVRSSLIVDAQFLVLVLPIEYRFSAGQRTGIEFAYRNTSDLLMAVYASQRLRFPFEGIALIGY
ncbi:hypothetical protein KM427_23125 [Nocardioides sp. LMS-CY]|uniref:hypothetical protein n=1 Tax=Nocardioides sp. (strain LMS-CY) TaxID=2840457 RepID=UPI001C008790|nr:hypothetical protein [Nocardioides sp. LMS-CY]QWF21782.1 hypothetical protein KM427_23125 [Nocardioides sp. LMS-CY]